MRCSGEAIQSRRHRRGLLAFPFYKWPRLSGATIKIIAEIAVCRFTHGGEAWRRQAITLYILHRSHDKYLNETNFHSSSAACANVIFLVAVVHVIYLHVEDHYPDEVFLEMTVLQLAMANHMARSKRRRYRTSGIANSIEWHITFLLWRNIIFITPF